MIFDFFYDMRHYLCSTFYEDVNNPDGYFDRDDEDNSHHSEE